MSSPSIRFGRALSLASALTALSSLALAAGPERVAAGTHPVSAGTVRLGETSLNSVSFLGFFVPGPAVARLLLSSCLSLISPPSGIRGTDRVPLGTDRASVGSYGWDRLLLAG